MQERTAKDRAALFCLAAFFVLGSLWAREARCQSSPKEVFHQQRDTGGELKEEYFLKEGKRHGLYRKYDEDGQIEYQEYYWNGVFDGVDYEYFYYRLYSWEHHIEGAAPEILLDSPDAVKKFSKDYELKDEPAGWDKIGIVRTRFPTGQQHEKLNPVTLSGISKNYIYLREFALRKKLVGANHFYYTLVHNYKTRRDHEVDALFNVPLILDVLRRRHTGIEFGTPFGNTRNQPGSRLFSVEVFLGDPDFVRPMDVLGWFDVYYESENLHLIGHQYAVYFMEERRPEWVGALPPKKTPDLKN